MVEAVKESVSKSVRNLDALETPVPAPVIKKDPTQLKGKEKLEWMRGFHNELVRGMFKFYEVPGGIMSFDFLEFKGDPVRHYDLKDGEVYSIPRGVAKHLNKNCWYPTYGFEMDAAGKQLQKIGEKVRRCGFHSLEFSDDEDLMGNQSRIVTVSNA